eukprot:TRINITY_DN10017_c0_g1_i1.p1 TRINITY_DN10017_c0_g1~~TRINITY_DN10017_c0_g1_i1.p1  ORF type:complete len:710 (+),score=103.53 TRINITY_DN10017_c0_g1_i1:61-2130(+)
MSHDDPPPGEASMKAEQQGGAHVSCGNVKKEASMKAEQQGGASPYVSCASCWTLAVERYTNLDALIFDGIRPELRFSFNDLESNANCLARNLMLLGIEHGERLVTIMQNRPELVVLLLSCLKLGVAFVPLATDLRCQDCQAAVAMYEPSLICCDQAQYAPFLSADGSERRTLILPSFRSGDNELKKLMRDGSNASVDTCAVLPDNPCIIFSTSGSTGMPKGVVFSSKTVGRVGSIAHGLSSQGRVGERTLIWISMRGTGGTMVLLSRMLQGSAGVMVDVYPNGPILWAELIDKYRIESNLLFGAAMHLMLQEMPNRTFESMKHISYGGSCFAPALVQRSMSQFPNAAFQQLYGLTEAFPISTLGPEHHKHQEEASQKDLRIMTSAGKVHSAADVFIEDLAEPGSGKPPPPEKDGVGQICVHSSCMMMMGYFSDSESTDRAMPDGKYMRTGDVGRFDDEGFLYILGRVKDIIPAYKGFNVAPRDVEEVLYTHPGVGQAAVVGIWHPSGAGEAVVAWISAKTGWHIRPSDLRRHCSKSGMPSWQVPDAIYICDGKLPMQGDKIANKVLQSESFRQACLAADLTRARHSCETRGQECLMPCSTRASAEQDLFAELLSGSAEHGKLCPQKLKTIFWDSLHEALQALHPGASLTQVIEKDRMHQLLAVMDADVRSAFVLGAMSLLKRWAADKIP